MIFFIRDVLPFYTEKARTNSNVDQLQCESPSNFGNNLTIISEKGFPNLQDIFSDENANNVSLEIKQQTINDLLTLRTPPLHKNFLK